MNCHIGMDYFTKDVRNIIYRYNNAYFKSLQVEQLTDKTHYINTAYTDSHYRGGSYVVLTMEKMFIYEFRKFKDGTWVF